jgi:hypothetical protein
MEIRAAHDLTGSHAAPTASAGCDHPTAAPYTKRREVGRQPDERRRRARAVDDVPGRTAAGVPSRFRPGGRRLRRPLVTEPGLWFRCDHGGASARRRTTRRDAMSRRRIAKAAPVPMDGTGKSHVTEALFPRHRAGDPIARALPKIVSSAPATADDIGSRRTPPGVSTGWSTPLVSGGRPRPAAVSSPVTPASSRPSPCPPTGRG